MTTRVAKPSAPKLGPSTVKRHSKVASPPASGNAESEDVIIAPALSSVIGYLLRRSHNAFQSYWMAEFYSVEAPITPVQGGMLMVIGSSPGLTQTALARIMNVEGPTLMQSIDRLEENGYLLRSRRIGDRRSNSLQLTPLGAKVLNSIQKFLRVRDADLLNALTGKEVAELVRLLTKIVTQGHARLKELEGEAPFS